MWFLHDSRQNKLFCKGKTQKQISQSNFGDHAKSAVMTTFT